VVDEYTTMGDGAPTKLTRTFETMESSDSKEMEMDMMGQVQSQNSSKDATSDLESQVVLFSWDSDADEFIASFPDDEGDEGLLEGLREDMDMRSLLPDGDVDKGDEWKLDPLSLRDIFAAGGNLHFVPEDSDEEDMMNMGSDMGSSSDWFNEDMEGEATAVFEGTRKSDDGVELGVIVFTYEISNAIDMTSSAQEALEEGEMPPGVEDMSIESVDIEVNMEGKGTLLWNMAEGCAYSLEIDTEVLMTMDMAMGISAQGMELDIEQNFEFSGSMGTTVSVE
jgi:hypothetical protein